MSKKFLLMRLGIMGVLASLGLWLTATLAQAAPWVGSLPTTLASAPLHGAKAPSAILRTNVPETEYLITVWPSVNGIITPGTQFVNQGSSITFTILPDTGYHTVDVIADGVGRGAIDTYTFISVTAPHVISAAFAINTYMITPTVVGSGGRIWPEGPQTLTHGFSQTFSILPDLGYHITGVWVDGAAQGAITAYTFENVAASHVLTATFAEDIYVVVPIVLPPGGDITPATPQMVGYGAALTFFITPNVGYVVENVGIDGISIGAVTSYTFHYITVNHIITAAFTRATFNLTPLAGLGGSISPATTIAALYGTSHTFHITPTVGYHIDQVSVDEVAQGPITSYTFTNVHDNHILVANFAPNLYTLTPAAGENGIISPTTPQTVAHGGSQAFTILPNPNYYVDNVWVDGATIGPVDRYTFTNVLTNHTLSATFTTNASTVLTVTISNTNGVTGSVIFPVNINCTATCTTTLSRYNFVVITATINNGNFLGWGGDCAGTNITCTLSMVAPRNVIAYFGQYQRFYLPFTYALPPCLNGAFETEPNNTATVANGPLCTGRIYQAQPQDIADWFYFNLPAAGPITISMTNNVASGVQLYLLDANSTFLGSASGGSALQITCANFINPNCAAGTFFPAGKYFVLVYAGANFNTTPYSLTVNYLAPPAP